MKKQIITASLLFALLVPAPSQAFSLSAPVKKAGHALKVVGKKLGTGLIYVAAGAAVIAFCSQGACN